MSVSLYTSGSNYSDWVNKARGHWPLILPAAGIDAKYLKNKHGPCPICNGKNRFRFDDKDGTGSWICNQCGAGYGLKLIQLFRNCSPKEGVQLVCNILGCKEIAQGLQHAPVTNPQSEKKLIECKRQLLYKTLNQSNEIITDDPVHKYLTITRRLPLSNIPEVLRTHPGLPYYEDNRFLGAFPTMLAKVENLSGELISLHRTFLTVDGEKAPVNEQKKLMPAIYEGATAGAAIRLYEANDKLILAEGIETALCGALYLGIPAWSCISAHGLVTVNIPDSVKEIVILADNDTSNTGQQAALKLARRLFNEQRIVKILPSPVQDTDWLDIVAND